MRIALFATGLCKAVAASALAFFATGLCKAVAVSALAFFATPALAAGERPEAFAYRMQLTIAPGAAFYRLEVPLAVHQGSTRSDLADLRVFNDAGEVVPFGFARGMEAAATAPLQAKLPIFPLYSAATMGDPATLDLQVRQGPDGTLVSMTTRGAPHGVGPQQAVSGYLIDASGNRRAIGALALDWASTDAGVNTRVGVEASDDLKTWRTVVAGAPVLDLQFAGQRLQQQGIALERVQARYFRLLFAGPPVTLSGVTATLVPDTPEAPRRTLTAAGRALPGQSNEFQFDLGAAIAVDRVAFVLPQVNTVAPAVLLARDQQSEPWRVVTNTVVYRLAGAAGEISSPALSIAATGARYWLLRVNPGSGGIGSGGLQMLAGHVPRHLVFVARGSGPFMLAYGKRSRAGEKDLVASAALPLASLMPGYQTGTEFSLPAAQTGAQVTANPAALQSTIADRFNLRNLALWAVLITAVLALALMEWRLARQMNKGG